MALLTRKSTAKRSKENVTVWVPLDVLHSCVMEADDKHPLETGGTFMGWWSGKNSAVVTRFVGPGPEADHGRYHFQPDQSWQLDQIAHHYEHSGRRETYLGDWHTHPGAKNGVLSWVDRGVLRRVINAPEARCPTPLMIIFWGYPTLWKFTAWRAYKTARLGFWDKLVLNEDVVKTYEST